MKSLTLEAYKLFYYLTGSEKLSYYGSMIALSVLHVIFLMGMTLLLDGIVKTRGLLWLFKFPFNIGVGLVVLIVNRLMVPPKLMDIAHNIHATYYKLAIFFGLAMIILFYYLVIR